jgi:hypothetical protein
MTTKKTAAPAKRIPTLVPAAPKKPDPLIAELRQYRKAFGAMAAAFHGLINASMANTKKLNELLQRARAP